MKYIRLCLYLTLFGQPMSIGIKVKFFFFLLTLAFFLKPKKLFFNNNNYARPSNSINNNNNNSLLIIWRLQIFKHKILFLLHGMPKDT